MNCRYTHFTARDLTLIALIAALFTVCSWISIPTGDVPITLQSFAIFVFCGLFDTKICLTAFYLYLLMGLMGLPVFSGMTGGIGRILGPTGGYLIGFIFAILTIGLITRRFGRCPLVLMISMILGMALCYLFGTLWFVIIYMGGSNAVSLGAALVKCVFPYLLPDGMKLSVALLVIRRLAAIRIY